MTTSIGKGSSPPAVSCDPVQGLCKLGASPAIPRVSITYVTDPICSACWAMEPAWRTLRYRYGDVFDVRLVYGGLLPGWDGFADPAAGISGATDVAAHWDEIARQTGQPINSSVWATDPIESSYPASIAAVAARLSNPDVEEAFLRHVREQLFLDGRNIAHPATWWTAAEQAGIAVESMRCHLAAGTAGEGFQADLALSRSSGANGFPTIIVEADSNRMKLHGTQSYARLEQTLQAVSGVDSRTTPVSVEQAIAWLGTGTSAEYAQLLAVDPSRVAGLLAPTGLRSELVFGGEVWRLDDN
jgi:protein-disulfide isomerase-like protein with CxxC motif